MSKINKEKIGLKDVIEGVYLVIWQMWCSTFKSKLEDDKFKNLDLEVYSKVMLEYILLYLHFGDMLVFSLTKEKRKVIIDEVLTKVYEALEKYDENATIKLFGEKTNQNLTKHFVYWSKMAYSINFHDLYNERQLEYFAYKELIPAKDKPLTNTLFWEFGKKISNIATGSPDDMRIIMDSVSYATDILKGLKDCLEELFKAFDVQQGVKIDNLSNIPLATDKQWSLIDGEVCRATNFSNALTDKGKFTAYGSITIECKKLPNKITGIICHKIDFQNLYKAFTNPLIKETSNTPAEVIFMWSKKKYNNLLISLFSFFMPKMVVLICPKEAYEFITNPDHKKEIHGEARFLKQKPIFEYKPEVIK